MDKNKKSNSIIYIIVIIISILFVVLILSSFKSGNKQEISGIIEYKSLQDIENSVSFELKIPAFLYKENDLKMNNVLGQIVTITNERYTLKASKWVDNNADPLGVYEEFDIDKKYESDKGSISYLRYRQNSNITILNWVNNSTAYGLMINELVNIEDTLKLIEITLDNFSEINENEEKLESTDNTIVEKLENENVKFEFYTNKTLDKIEIPNEAIYYKYEDRTLLLVVYNNPNKYINSLTNNQTYKEFNGLYI